VKAWGLIVRYQRIHPSFAMVSYYNREVNWLKETEKEFEMEILVVFEFEFVQRWKRCSLHLNIGLLRGRSKN
jgi:hypothetical protein